MTRIGILETGKPRDPIMAKYGDFPQMFMTYFSGQPDMTFIAYRISSGDPLPALNAADAWIITGSPAGVYEDHPWIAPLQDFVRQTIKLGTPTLGVCFGHQLMAQALGGTVTKSDKGRAAAIHDYHLSPEGKAFFGTVEHLSLVAMHQDQVIAPPPEATVLAGSDFCPFASLAYGDAGLSLQPHPEFTPKSGRDIAAQWHECSPVGENEFHSSQASFDKGTINAHSIAVVLRNFLCRKTKG